MAPDKYGSHRRVGLQQKRVPVFLPPNEKSTLLKQPYLTTTTIEEKKKTPHPRSGLSHLHGSAGTRMEEKCARASEFPLSGTRGENTTGSAPFQAKREE